MRERAAQYVLGELAPAERAEFERHRAADGELAREVEALQRLIGILPFGAAVDPPPALRARVLAAVEPRTASPASRRASRLVVRLVGAVAAVLALALGLDAYRARRDLALERELRTALQQPNVVLDFTLVGRGDAAGAEGRVSLDLDARRGAVALHDLPPLPPDRVYRLWAAVGDRTVPCGAFAAVAHGRLVAQFSVPVDAYAAPIGRLFLTLEPATLPPAPTGPTVMESVAA
jgi:anti-sigma-K factor RskA